MIRIDYRYRGEVHSVYAKLEYFNLSGSIKDRIACRMIDKAEEKGLLKPGQPVIETTSGNTGIAISAYGAFSGHPVHIFMPDWVSGERRKIMEMYGATLHLVSREEGGFLGGLAQSKTLAAELGGFITSQFDNTDNADAHYFGTGAEILQQLPEVTDFVSGVGSGGTIMGTGRRLKEARNAYITAVEPDAVPLLSGGSVKGSHKIEGIGDDFIPALVDRKMIDQVFDIRDTDAVCMAAKLAKELGLGVGISSGANLIGAVLRNAQAPGRVIATVFSDDSKKYLSTSLADNPQPEEDMVSAQVELLDYALV